MADKLKHQWAITKYIIGFALVLFSVHQAFATWSIIIIDPETKEIGIAGASCTYNCYGIGKIVPNAGAIIVQAMSNNAAREKGIQMILLLRIKYERWKRKQARR